MTRFSTNEWNDYLSRWLNNHLLTSPRQNYRPNCRKASGHGQTKQRVLCMALTKWYNKVQLYYLNSYLSCLTRMNEVPMSHTRRSEFPVIWLTGLISVMNKRLTTSRKVIWNRNFWPFSFSLASYKLRVSLRESILVLSTMIVHFFFIQCTP